MELRILGAHNFETAGTRHTCFLVDGVLALDAGSLVTALTLEEMCDIRAVLLTHRHFDHVRDLPSLGLITCDAVPQTVPIYSLPETLEDVSSRLMDGVLYPRFTEGSDSQAPKYRLEPLKADEVVEVLDYEVRPIAVPHGPPALGYIIHRPGGGAFAISGDTGGGLLPFFQDSVRPDPLCVEVTFPNRMEERARSAGHLTPRRLLSELTEALEHNLTLPRILAVHMHPVLEGEIRGELDQVASALGVDIGAATEDMRVNV